MAEYRENNFMRGVDILVAILLIVGGLNWGLVGLFNFNVVAAVFGDMSPFTRFIYAIVGLAALYRLFLWRLIERRQCAYWPGAQSTVARAGL